MQNTCDCRELSPDWKICIIPEVPRFEGIPWKRRGKDFWEPEVRNEFCEIMSPEHKTTRELEAAMVKPTLEQVNQHSNVEGEGLMSS